MILYRIQITFSGIVVSYAILIIRDVVNRLQRGWAEEKAMFSESVQNKAAQAIVDGIKEYLNNNVHDNVQSTDNNKEIRETNNQIIEVFFADPQIERIIGTEEEISYTNSNEKYKQAFESLQKETHPDMIPLWNKIELLSVTFDEGMLTLNIQISEEARLGTSGEQLALDALRNTIFQFDEVRSIDILVDGKVLDSLMGHADLEHPITRDN